MIPPGWEHPKDADGQYVPLLNSSYSKRLAEWEEAKAKWAAGFTSDFRGGWIPLDEDERGMTFEEYEGERPTPDAYMPDWPADQRTLYVMYEDTSEGTPISPPFETPEALARWLADTGASAFGRETASYEGWLGTIKRGSAIGLIVGPNGVTNGVELNREP